MGTGPKNLYEFGPFRLDTVQQLLLRDGQVVPLPLKDLEILLVLVDRCGQVVKKEELLDKVWPGTFVEEGNLTRHVSSLRQALGEGQEGKHYIETIPKRGYRFVAPVREGPKGISAEDRAVSAAEATPRVRRRWLAPVLTSGAVLAVVAGLVLWLTMSRPALSFASRDWVLITDFENTTGEPRFDKALLTAFTVDLEQSNYSNVFPRARVEAALKRMGKGAEQTVDEALGREICLREGIRGLVRCSITRTGQQYAITARLLDPKNGDVARSYTARAHGEDQILDALDNLAEKIRQGLGESLYSISRANRPLPQVTTPSLQALQLYTEGNSLWRKARHLEGVELYKSALQADPDFAMAHSALGVAYYSHAFSDPVRGKQHYEKALQLAGRTTERERALIEAQYVSDRGETQAGAQLYLAYLKTYPDDLSIQFTLANLYLRERRLVDAITRLKEVVRIDPANAGAWINLATCHTILGKYTEALQSFGAAFEREPAWITSQNLNHEYGFTLVGAGQEAKAREVFEKAIEKPEVRDRGLRSLALLDLYQGKYRDAKARLTEAIRLEDAPDKALNRARNHLYLAGIFEGQLDRAGELRELDAAEKALAAGSPPLWLESRIGIAYARAGALAQSSRVLGKMHADPKSPEQMRDIHRLQGEYELARKNSMRAIELLETADREAHDPLTQESLAYAYDRAGQREQALAAYEKLADPQGGWLGWEPQQPRLAAYEWLGQAYHSRGENEKARKSLDPLLALWKNADPDLPLLRSAQQLRKELAH